jgi:hypothetical protein
MNPEQLAEILNTCLMRGFHPPLHLCAVSVNGAVIVVRYAQNADQMGMTCKVLAEHYPGPGFVLPVNMMVSDASGEAVRVVLRQPDQWSFADLN